MKHFTTLKKVLSFFIFISFYNSMELNAQHFCGFDKAMQELYTMYPELKEEQAKFLENSKKFIRNNDGSSRVVYTIPIVFHVMHEYGVENISDQQIIDQVERLNIDFRKSNADTSVVIPAFKSLIADARIEFKLASIDFQGNCTNGIDRIYTHESRNGDMFSKLNSWPRERYLNVWVASDLAGMDNTAAYALYPSAVDNPFGYFIDGIMVRHNYVGGNLRTLTHEIGHWLGLSHPWGDTNDPMVACGNDGIDDTPFTKGWNHCTNITTPNCTKYNVPKTYSFADVTTTSGMIDTSSATMINGITFNQFSANGVSANSDSAGVFAFSNWDTGADNGDSLYDSLTGSINTAQYYEVTLTPKLGYTMELMNISFEVHRNETGVRTYAVRSSVNNYSSNLAASVNPTSAGASVAGSNVFFIKEDTTKIGGKSTITLSGASYIDTETPVTFRFYGWNAEDANGTFGIDNILFSDSSGVIENVQNYMEYAHCSRMFTKEQALSMESALNSEVASRNNLWTGSNHEATGIDIASPPVCAPVADFSLNSKFYCEGTTVTFQNHSWRAAADTYEWSFPEGNPSTSNQANPNVTYSTPGWKKVTLTASNAAGSDTKAIEKYVYIAPLWSDLVGPYNEDFDSNTGYWWLVNNPGEDAAKWEYAGWGEDAKKGYRLINVLENPPVAYYQRLGGRKDALISPSFDLSHTTGASLSFKYSCATRADSAASIAEELIIYVSTDCGKTWTLRKTISGTALTNAGLVDGSYVPTLESQWKTETITLPSTFLEEKVRFKFEYVAGDFSNNIYIDNVSIDGVLGVEDQTLSEYFSLNIFPNPSKDDQNLTVSYISKGNTIKIAISDLVGKTVYTLNENKGAGENTTTIDMSDAKLKAGVYFLNISDGVYKQTKKVVIY